MVLMETLVRSREIQALGDHGLHLRFRESDFAKLVAYFMTLFEIDYLV